MCPRVSEQIRQSAETDHTEGAAAVSVWSWNQILVLIWFLAASMGT